MENKVKQLKVKIEELKKIKTDVYSFSFSCLQILKTAQPGNFLHVKIGSVILRRPFSIHRIKGNRIYILFRVRGRGTQALCQHKRGDLLDIIGPLGRGFNFSRTPVFY